MSRAAFTRKSPAAGVAADLPVDIPTEMGACALCERREGARLASGPDFEYDTTRMELALWRCPCGGVYLDPRPAPSALERIYPPDYYAYDFADRLRPIVRRVKAFAERAKLRVYRPFLQEGSRVLDIGCADGELLAALGSSCGLALGLEGVEFSPPAIAAAERRGITVHRGRIEEVSLPAQAFDVVIMNQLIEHVRDPLALLRAVARALRPGGHVFVETPNLDSLDARLFRRRYWGGYHLPRHFHLFDRRTLPALARRAGLVPLSLRPLVCPQFWILSLHNAVADWGARRLATRLFNPLSPFWLAPFTLIELVHQRVWWTSNLQMIARQEA
jgi:SAM-dependent methyltransferase